MEANKGFTLIELIMVVVITAIIAAISGMVLVNGVRSYGVGEAVTPLANKGSAALTQMTVDLNAAVQFTTVNLQDLVFVDINGDTITYDYTGNTLTRKLNSGAAYVVTDQLTGFSLNFYTSAYGTTSTPSAVRIVTIQMTLTGANSTLSLINSVFPRNAL
jgi:prepilin-type N-terminal cleavage/methylation domain-containing protein